MSSSQQNIPQHLKKYVVSQNYERYTSEEQATWRYLLRQLRDFLSRTAHPCYLEGLEKTGISINRIPKISEMDELLQKFGWGAVPVSGFIPPAAFMEFQSLGILPIASDMRSLDHFLYTPAPDIVHEAAGHAPILIHPEYAQYLKSYAQVAKKAIISKEDLDQYEAIRKLSDLKEHPNSTKGEIALAEKKLNDINAKMSHVSEASLLSRMNWWTAEYGLVGSLADPKIYGAGLLSSLGESRECLKPHVKKIPLDVSCIEVSYDITEPQPQLFVTPDFCHLLQVLEDLAKRLSFTKGGVYGLTEAKKANSVNTIELDSGIQLSGVLDYFVQEDSGTVSFLKLSGPCQLALNDRQIEGHGKEFHTQGYSTPLGAVKELDKPLHKISKEEAERIGLIKGQKVNLQFTSGIKLQGTLISSLSHNDHFILLSFKNCLLTRGEEKLFDPSWGQFDLACGAQIHSVFGGPADRVAFGELEDFVAETVPSKTLDSEQKELFSFYGTIAAARQSDQLNSEKVTQLWQAFKARKQQTWLMGLEILELAILLKITDLTEEIPNYLFTHFGDYQSNIQDGIRLTKVT